VNLIFERVIMHNVPFPVTNITHPLSSAGLQLYSASSSSTVSFSPQPWRYFALYQVTTAHVGILFLKYHR
jgi:hypothetical protein